jgi:hypothetical protein
LYEGRLGPLLNQQPTATIPPNPGCPPRRSEAVLTGGLFRYTAAAGLGAPARVCVSQRDGEQTRIDSDQATAFFSKFPETAPSDVPGLLDTKMIKVFEDAAT